LVEDLYYDVWGDSGPRVLMYTLYLLDKTAGDLHPASDYAYEILRIFWQVLMAEATPTNIRRFIRAYANLCLTVFERTGLVTISGDRKPESRRRGGFLMGASELFRNSLRFDWR
jgi:hypothetical protein